MSKDASGLTPQERHQLILDGIKEVNRTPQVFQLRWCPGDLLDEKILKSTPIFWYMRFGWGRDDVEKLFYKAKIYVDPVFEQACDKVFGTKYKGPRWLPPDKQREKQAQWDTRGFKKTDIWWKMKQVGALHASQNPLADYKNMPFASSKMRYEESGSNKKGGTNDGKSNTSNSQDRPRRRSLLDRNLSDAKTSIWQAASNYGENKIVDKEKFIENMKEQGITMNPLIADKLLNACFRDGKFDQNKLNALLQELDKLKGDFNANIGNITLNDLNNPLEAKLMMKRVLLAASLGMPFSVDEFMVNKVNIAIMQPGLLCGKLASRDADWDFRVKALEDLSNGLGKDPRLDDYFEPEHLPSLLMGWMTQTLDERENVGKTALETLPNVYNEMLDKGNTDQALSHLDDVIDGLFRVLDNPRYRNNKKEAQQALSEILDGVAKSGRPEAVLYAVGVLSEQMDTGKNTNPEARKEAMEQLKKLLFGDGTFSWEEIDPDHPASLDSGSRMLPPEGSANREWLNMADGTQKAPSDDLYHPHDDGVNSGKRDGVEYGDDDDDVRKGKRRGDDIEDETTYGGDTQTGRKVRAQQKTQLPEKPVRKGKENEMAIRFGKARIKTDPIDETSEETNKHKAAKNVGSQSHATKGGNQKYEGDDEERMEGGGGRGNEDKKGDPYSDKNPNTTGGRGDPNDPNNKNGRSGSDSRGKSGQYPDDSDDRSTSKHSGNKNKGNPEDIKSNRGREGSKGKRDGIEQDGGSRDGDDYKSSGLSQGGGDNNSKDNDSKDDRMVPEDVAEELKNAVKTGLENGLNDPNKDNSDNASKLVHVMNAKTPGFSKELDKEAQKKYFKWKGSQMKAPKKPDINNKILPQLPVGEKRMHTIDQNVQVTVKAPTLPDI